MELTIDDIRCDIGCEALPAWSWEAAELCDPEALREGRSTVLTLPSTAVNDRVFGYALTPHGARRFNRELHTAVLRHEEQKLLDGHVRLLACHPEEAAACYRIEIRSGAVSWARLAASLPLHQLAVGFSGRLTPSLIAQSWTEGGPVCFLPIRYDDYEDHYHAPTLLEAERILSVDDYHPFLRLADLVEAIVSQGGYRLESDFLTGDFFRSLYMSGAYAQRDTTAAERRMAFFARRRGAAEATANYSGRVYASPFLEVHSVGNLVDALTPQSDEAGEPIEDVFTTGGYLRMEEGALLFRPPVVTDVGFEYRIVYRTDYRIRSRTRLTGFDSVYLGPHAEMPFEIANRFTDRRGSVTGSRAYRLVVFDHAEGDSYRLETPGGSVLAAFSERAPLVTMPASGYAADPVLRYRPGSSGSWLRYPGDWALYDGYIGETGRLDVELNLRTAPERVGPSSPKRFDTIYFYGAEPGMTFRLLQPTALKPYFSSRPGVGSTLSFEAIARHGIRQSELLAALGHLFNLRFFTDEEEKRVCIEPADAFYASEEPVDWSDRMVDVRTLSVEEWDNEQHEVRRLGYRAGDGTVERFNAASDEAFGDWSSTSPSMAAKMGCEVRRNPLFAPTLNVTGVYTNAPSASVPAVGDRDDTESVDAWRFVPRIVRFAGMRELPEGERWSYPAAGRFYPFAAFHHAGGKAGDGTGFTLCFEDRDGVQGLHRYYDRERAVGDLGLRLRTTLRLSPAEAEGLRHRSRDGQAGVDSLFRLRIGGEPVRCRLEAVERYEPQNGTARCRFLLIDDDRP